MPLIIRLPVFLLFIALTISASLTPSAASEKKAKTTKRLPKKIKVPEGYIPVDPTKVEVNDNLYSTAELKLQEALVKDENFQGVVQFIRGEVLWTDTGKQPDPQFKTILKKGDALKIGADSFVKVVTQKRCIGVVYGPSTLTMPKSKEDDVWDIEDSTVRWICPGKSEEKLQIAKRPLTLFASEIFYRDNKLLVVKGEPQAENGSLEEKKLYVGKATQFRPLKKQPHPHQLWEMNQEISLPKESNLWDEPEKPRNYRFSLGPQLGYGPFQYGNGDIQGAIPNDIKGGRLTAYFHRNKKVYFLSLNSNERTTGARPVASGSNYVYTGSLNIDTISFGLRQTPENEWSYTYRVGIGGSELKPYYYNGGSSYNHTVTHGVLQLAFGADWILQIQGWEWLGFVITAEVQFTKSLGGARFKDNGYNPGDPLYSTLESNGFTSIDFMLHAAPLFYF